MFKRISYVVLSLLLVNRAFAYDEDFVNTAAFSRNVSVAFSGTSATVVNLAGAGVTCTQSGAVLIFSNSLEQVSFTLSGTTTAGAFKLYSDHAFKLVLNGVTLTSSVGPAINIQSKKRGYIVLPTGTTSTLKDATTYVTQYNATNGVEDAKGVMFSEGQLIFSGDGVLSVNGVCTDKNGIASDQYVRLLGGDIRVSMTKKSDGIHPKDGFRMDGGKLAIALTLKGDGIDADDDGSIAINGGELALALAKDDSKGIKCGTNTFTITGGAVNVSSTNATCNALSGGGDMILDGGFVNVALSGADCRAVKSDHSITINGGSVSATLSGAQSKAIKTDGDVIFNGGTVNFSLLGGVVFTTATNTALTVYADPSYCTGVKASNIVVNAGSFAMLAGGTAAKGFSADNDLTINGGTFALDASGPVTGTYTNEEGLLDIASPTCLKADGTLLVNGGTFMLSIPAMAAKGFSSDTSIRVNGGIVDLDLSGAPTFLNRGSYLDPSYCSGIKCGGGIIVSNGTFTIRHSGVAGKGFSADGDMTLAGGSFSITTTGANTSIYTSGVYTVNGAISNIVDVGTATALKSDGNLIISAGTYNLLATGNCGKCINVDGGLIIGTSGSSAPVIIAKTTGQRVLLSGGTPSGQRPGGGPDDNADYSNPKTIKTQGKLTINGGSISVSTANEGGEGIESKDTLTINGGSIDANCYDDCMNATTNITINGGTVFCDSSSNDAIDSNGTMTLNGGIVTAFGTTAPEEGFDCDSNTFTVNGGSFIGCGGATSYPTTGSQYSLVYTGSLTSNTVMRIEKSSTSIFAFKMPRTYSGSVKLLCGNSNITSSGTYYVYTGATMTGAAFHGLCTNDFSSTSGGTSKGSTSTKTGVYYAITGT